LIGSVSGRAQIFWTENFESGSTGGALASSYTGPNGAWTVVSTGTTGVLPNDWYVSCAENGHTAGVCGTGCAAVSSTATLATLHIGAAGIGGDMGASYFSGGFTPGDANTNARAQSPTINCTGKTSITLSFNYIENGDGTTDDATVWYYDGATWSFLSNPAKTTICGGGQGTWAHYTIALPTSANNNPSVKIGFNWTNDDDAVGTDPSFAVDSVSLSGTSASTVPTASYTLMPNDTVCADSCITFTSTSAGGTIDSIKWAITPTVTMTSSTTSPLIQCFPTSAAYTVTLTAYGGGGNTNSVQNIYIKPKPSPTIAKAGHTLTVPTGYTSYQWYNGTTLIAGATNNTYTYTGSGIFTVVVDSGSCKGTSKNIINTAGIPQVSSTENVFWTSRDGSSLTIWSKELLKEALTVSIFDATGRRLMQEQWAEGADMKVIGDLSLAPGLYIIRLNDNSGGTVSLKIME
jgi:hypothetical protein